MQTENSHGGPVIDLKTQARVLSSNHADVRNVSGIIDSSTPQNADLNDMQEWSELLAHGSQCCRVKSTVSSAYSVKYRGSHLEI